MKPLIHAKNSVRKFGGKVDDYLHLHNWMDSTKAHVPDLRHRMVLHNSWGIFIGEQIFGTYFKNSDGKDVSVRDILELHVVDDLGHIPTLEKCLSSMVAEPWMGAREFRGAPMRVSLSKHNIEIVD
jgi:hypothetical protein